MPSYLLSPRAIVATASIALALSSMDSAVAHSRNETTIPADGATLRTAPEMIVMTFNRPIRITMIELKNADGDEISLERSGGMAPVTRVEATPVPLSSGSYSVQWRGLAADGHPMSCRFTFDVQP